MTSISERGSAWRFVKKHFTPQAKELLDGFTITANITGADIGIYSLVFFEEERFATALVTVTRFNVFLLTASYGNYRISTPVGHTFVCDEDCCIYGDFVSTSIVKCPDIKFMHILPHSIRIGTFDELYEHFGRPSLVPPSKEDMVETIIPQEGVLKTTLKEVTPAQMDKIKKMAGL